MQHEKNERMEAKPYFNIVRLSGLSSEEEGRKPATTNDLIQISWLTDGEGKFFDPTMQETDLQAGTLLITRQKRAHIRQLSADALGYTLFFSETFLLTEGQEFCPLDHAGLNGLFQVRGGIQLSRELMEEMAGTAEYMCREQSGSYPFRTTMLRRYLKILLMQASRNLKETIRVTGQSRNHEIMWQFLDLIEAEYKNKRSVSDYADHLSLSSNHLNAIIKKTTGYPASHHIRQRVILEAKRKAVHSGACMKEVAYALGFNDLAHFSKYFKAASGRNFTEYKKDPFITSPPLPRAATTTS